MMQAKITSKGQITVPVKVRRALGVRAGDKLLFEKDGDDFRMRPLKTKRHRGYGLLTFDERLYRAAFPRLRIMTL